MHNANLRKCLSVVVMSAILSFSPADIPAVYAADNAALIERIAALETDLGVTSENDALIGRVSALEEICFGSAQSGSLNSRIQSLEEAVYGIPSGGQSTDPEETESASGEYLTEKEYFSRDSWVDSGHDGEDSFGNHYAEVIFAGYGSMDSSVKNLKYYLNGDYSKLEATLFIPKAANTSSSAHSYHWDTAAFTIYITDTEGNETAVYQKDDFTADMKPLDITVDLSDADFMRFEWRSTYYIDTGAARPLFQIGEAMLYKK